MEGLPKKKEKKKVARTKKIDFGGAFCRKNQYSQEQIETEIAALSDNISVLKEQLKSKKNLR